MPSSEYLTHYEKNGPCFEVGPAGHCDRTDDHYTHVAKAANGRILGIWRVRREIEAAPLNEPLWSGR